MKYLILLLTCVLSLSNIKSQCNCGLPSFEKSLENTDNIFLGIVERKSLNRNKLHKSYPKGRGIQNIFIVQGIIKGNFNIGEEVKIFSGNGINDRGYDFKLGENYIVFYEEFIDSCTYTQIYSKEKIKEIKNIIGDSTFQITTPEFYVFETKQFRYQYEKKYYLDPLKPKILKNENPSTELKHKEFQKEVLCFINEKMGLQNGELAIRIIYENEQNEYIYGTFGSSKEIQRRIKELLTYIENNFIITTKGYDCLIDGTQLEIIITY